MAEISRVFDELRGTHRMTSYDGIPIIDTHIGFRESGYDEYAFITRQVTVRAFVSYEIRDSSNAAISDYNKLDFGGGANLTVRF